MINRVLSDIVRNRLGSGKAIVILGPRQVGKTTLIRHVLKSRMDDTLWLNADEEDVRLMLSEASTARLRALIGNKKIVVIDEAQRVHDVGIKLKLITDGIPEVQLMVSGSSALEIANRINEPLTGRKWEYNLYPISFEEMALHHGLLDETRLIPHRLVFGYYPDVINYAGDEREVLTQLVDSFLYKDILSHEAFRKTDKLVNLLKALAFQVGSQVSYNELSKLVGLESRTVEKYIELLEQSFVIFRVSGFSRNLRTELKKGKKIYFYDNGIRNALIGNLNHLESRSDVGALWENFVFSERKKYLQYHRIHAQMYFWRTTEQQEVDYLEEMDGKLSAYEIKWQEKKSQKFSVTFMKNYPEATCKFIHPGNVHEFIS
ncbi:MAG: ATP-binding protein [Flavobacteriales bacterium]